MKSILLGYKDIDGKGESSQLAGTHIPFSEQNKTLAECREGKFPNGIVRVEQWDDDGGSRRRIAICIKAYAIANPPLPEPDPIKVEISNQETETKGNKFFGTKK